ncbi:acyl-CoA-binding domain-containing protein 4 isoform X2 [Brienomyrus brachyistius]|uniref:acyl-CoA-binding domain-containing protein 4 isoform X2 n=1 Tax=Brienomyrus brachyistius TaxID=42636 RepID=UPI0020B31C32|nr:acyl-CoA-binding domain-containing protein 4 isoform X2 [Brienomyrus brachyistius]
MPRDTFSGRGPASPAAGTMTEPKEHFQKRFQAAVDVIQKLPKNGVYRPSYDVMLRFYGLYKQAVCGPCRASRPGFWDPVGRYKWDAWSRLGEMSSEAAMTAYVEEMKKVAEELINNIPVNEKTASLFHYFEPLYLVIHDMPQPPEALLSLRAELEGSVQTATPADAELKKTEEETTSRRDDYPRNGSALREPASPEYLVATSDSENEIFCDSFEQLDQNKATQVGAGQGGEGAGERWGPPKKGKSLGREPHHRWREEMRGRPHGRMQHANEGASGNGDEDGDRWEGGPSGQREMQMQQEIIFALRQLQEDMRSVMERLEAVERLTAAQTQGMDWRSTDHLSASGMEERWWSPFSMSSRAALLLLLWPCVVHWLMFLLRRRYRK